MDYEDRPHNPKTYQFPRPHDTFSNASDQAIYNIYGIKVASYPKEIDSLPPGVYITNGKKIVIK